MNNTHSKKERPISYHIHYGQNYLRILALILLIGIILASIYSIQFMGGIMIVVIIAALFGLSCIRIPRIYLYIDGFEVEKKCIIDRFTDRDFFNYKEIETIEFIESKTDWGHIVAMILFGSGGYGGDSKADQMIIKTTDNKTFSFNRFGTRENLRKTIELIKRNKPST